MSPGFGHQSRKVDRVLRRLGLVRQSLLFEAIHAIDNDQRDFLQRGQCTAWAICTHLDEAVAKSRNEGTP